MFCKFLSNTYHFTYDHVKPCCWIKNTERTQIKLMDPDSKEKLNEIRKIDDWIPECDYCRDLETSGTMSPRTQYANDKIYSASDLLGEPVKVELQLDEECNAACLICGTWNSTTWQKYETKTVGGKTYPTHRWSTTVNERITAVENIIDFDKTRQIHFFGGEPFMSDTQLKMLRRVKYPELVNLVYVTNGSAFSCEETLELWKNFKSVHIGISIDGVGEHFNYLRWPLQWHQVENNLIKYFNLSHANLTINSSFTATPLNIWYIDEYTSWAMEFAQKNPTNKTDLSQWFMNPHPVVDTMDMSAIPIELQDDIRKKYGASSRVAKIMKKFDRVKALHLLNYINLHDRHRKLNWQQVFPEMVTYYDVDIISPLPKKRIWEIKPV